MDGGFTDAKLLCGGADRGLVLHDVKGKALRPLLHVLFQNASLPAYNYPILCGGRDAYAERMADAGETVRFYTSITVPSVARVTTCQGMKRPLCCRARFAACSIPPQQGTCMRTTVRLLMSFSRRMAVSFSA